MNSVVSFSRHWWWILLCALLGAGFANLVFQFLPMQYTVQTLINITFDFHSSLNWTDKSMLELSDTIGEIVVHPATIQTVLDKAARQNIHWSEKQFRKNTGIEQRYYGWELTVRAPMQTEAQTMLEIWSETVYEILREEQFALRQAAAWQTKIDIMVSCLQHLPVEPPHPTCRYGNELNLRTAFFRMEQEQTEQMADLNFLKSGDSAFVINPPYQQNVQQHAMSKTSSIGVVLSTLIGGAIGYLTLQKNIPERLNKKRDGSPS